MDSRTSGASILQVTMATPSIPTSTCFGDSTNTSSQAYTGTQSPATLQNAYVRQSPLTPSTDSTQAITATPLPNPGTALSDAFYSPDVAPSHRSSMNSVAGESTSKYLNRIDLQRDMNCRELSELHYLIGTIFAYSNQCPTPSTNPIELAAGFRYFLPNGRLAHEWIRFWDVAPDRYLHMAPPQIIQAYHNERCDLERSSMRVWVHDAIKQRETREADSPCMFHEQVAPKHEAVDFVEPWRLQVEKACSSTQTGASKSTPQPGSAKRRADVSLVADWEDHDFAQEGDDRLRFTKAKRLRLDVPINSQSISAGSSVASVVGRRCLATSGGTASSRLRTQAARVSSVAPARAQPSLITSRAPPVITAHHPQAASRSLNQQLAPGNFGLAPGLISAPTPGAHSVLTVQSLPATAIPHVLAAHQLLPAGNVRQPVAIALHNQPQPNFRPDPNRRRIPNARLASRHPLPVRIAGSVQHMGQGNAIKAWSLERCRAFTEIQGYPLSELPKAYNSQYGDELSRSHTPISIDPRQCPFSTTMEELITVSFCG
jgi:hypothetical protein